MDGEQNLVRSGKLGAVAVTVEPHGTPPDLTSDGITASSWPTASLACCMAIMTATVKQHQLDYPWDDTSDIRVCTCVLAVCLVMQYQEVPGGPKSEVISP